MINYYQNNYFCSSMYIARMTISRIIYIGGVKEHVVDINKVFAESLTEGLNGDIMGIVADMLNIIEAIKYE